MCLLHHQWLFCTQRQKNIMVSYQDTITWLLSQPSFWVSGLKIACLRQGPDPSLISFFKNVVVFDCCSYLLFQGYATSGNFIWRLTDGGSVWDIVEPPIGVSGAVHILYSKAPCANFPPLGCLYSQSRRIFTAQMRSAIKLRRLLQTGELLYAPLYYKMPFLPYEASHSVRGCLQRTAAPKGQMICNDCCRHL